MALSVPACMDEPGPNEPGMNEPGMNEPVDPSDYAREPVYCSTSAIEGVVPMMAWRVEVIPGGRCHEMTLRYDVAGHHEGDSPVPVDVIEESGVVVGPVDADRIEVSTADATLDVSGVDGHPGLWTGTLARAGEEYAVACFSSIWQPRFQYDATGGACVDGDGVAGLNPTPIPVVRDSGVGQCADLGGLMLNENDLSYPEWRGFDLRGADMSDAQLSFAHIYDSQLEGAQMATLTFGYAFITGTIDQYTGVPAESCTTTEGTIDCMR